MKYYLYRALTFWMPNTRFMAIKRCLLRLAGVQVGKNVKLASTVSFRGRAKMILEDDVTVLGGVQIGGNGHIRLRKGVFVAENNFIQATGTIDIGEHTKVYQSNVLMANGESRLIIGRDCQIAHMCSLKTSTHDIEPSSNCMAGQERYEDILIGDGCWICAGVIVIPGVSVGRKNVIAAGSVVIHNTEDYVLMAGVPAQCKKRYAVEND